MLFGVNIGKCWVYGIGRKTRMPAPTDWTSKKYGRLTFIRPTDERRQANIKWEALCDCGKTVIVVPKDGVSCGCFKEEMDAKRSLSKEEKAERRHKEWEERRARLGPIKRDISSLEAKERRVIRNRTLIREYLSTHPCVDCGDDRWEVLEFDHVRGEKEQTVGFLSREGSIERIEKEIEKCDVRCANCHRLKTIKEDNHWRNTWDTDPPISPPFRPQKYMKGEGHLQSKLTEKQVLAIREEYANGGTPYRVLASKYGVGWSTIERIIKRETWKHV